MTDPHRTFAAWLAGGAPGEPPRDAALHASVCDECLGWLAALDALWAVDVGSASPPASRTAAAAAVRRITVSPRLAALTAAGTLGAVLLGVSGSLLLAGRPPVTPLRGAGDVLGGTGTPAATRSPLVASPDARATPRESGVATSPRPSAKPARTARPTFAPRPTLTPPTARPTPRPTPTPSPAFSVGPTPTITPTSTPFPSPTTPSASASPS